MRGIGTAAAVNRFPEIAAAMPFTVIPARFRSTKVPLTVTGEVRLALTPGVGGAGGQCFVVGRKAPKSLYDYGLATYDSADRFHHADSEGFVRLWGLGVQTWSSIQGLG